MLLEELGLFAREKLVERIVLDGAGLVVVMLGGCDGCALFDRNAFLVEELDAPRLDLDDIAAHAVLIFEDVTLELPVDEDGAPLLQSVRAAVREPVPSDDADVADFLLPL